MNKTNVRGCYQPLMEVHDKDHLLFGVTSYRAVIDVEVVSYQNLQKVAEDILDSLFRVFNDNLIETKEDGTYGAPDRKHIIRDMSPSWLLEENKMEAEKQAKRDLKTLELTLSVKEAPKELIAVVESVLTNNANVITQYKYGNTKAINSLVGMVMKQYKYDAAVIKQLLEDKLNV